MKSILLLAFISLFSTTTQASVSDHQCGTDTLGGSQFKWCIDRPENPSGEILWYFHAVFNSEQSWRDHETNVAIRESWQARGVAQPTVISISQGSFWLMTLENKMYPTFVNQILPYLEQKTGGLHGRRLLMGYSMGGFNASQLLFRDGSLFDRVAILSPAFLGVSPFAEKSEIDAYFQRNNIGFVGRFKVNTFIGLLKGEFKTNDAWEEHNPLELVRAGLPRNSVIYISAGEQDNYGFHEGASLFVNTLEAKGLHVQWESLQGGHRETNPEGVAQFLLPSV